MEFIKLEQFKGLEERIQKVFLNRWKPKRYDLYIDSSDLSQVECLDYINSDEEGIIYHSMRDNMSIFEDMIPMLTEGQLRRFIEDKTDSSMSCRFEKYENIFITDAYYIVLYDFVTHKIKNTYESEKHKRIDAYWQVALEIAKEEIR